MGNNINIAPTISPDILKTISVSTVIKTFGNQTKDKNKETVIIGDQTKTADLNSELNSLTEQEKQAGLNKDNTIRKAQSDLNTKQITEEQYNAIIAAANVSYNAEIETISIQRQNIQTEQNSITNDPNNQIKKDQTSFKSNIKTLKSKTTATENQAKKDTSKQVASSIIKTIVPTIALQLTNSFASIISQRKKLEELVNSINDYITNKVTDEQTATIATNLRNNAITLINNSIKKLQSLERILNTINTVITIFNLLITILSSLPIPTAVPPGIGIPLTVITKITNTITKARTLVSSLSALLSIVTVLLSTEILKLIELRDRLKQISLKLETKSVSLLNEDELKALSDQFLPVAGQDFGTYKGFKFKIKEEQNPKFVVKGNKRRYAVAVDRYGVEIIKSEYSFTLDPNDLVEQLKLIIDRQNLQG